MTQEKLAENASSGWDDLVSAKFLKAEEVEKGDTFMVLSKEIKQWDDNEKPKLRLQLGHKTKGRYVLDCNATNTNYLAQQCPNPEDVVGKTLSFDKVKVYSPHHKKEVDSLRIQIEVKK